MPAIAGAELQLGLFVGEAPADGVVAVIAGDGSVQVLERWDPATGDVLHEAPAGTNALGGTRRHLFDAEVYANNGTRVAPAYVNVRAWASITGKPTTVQGYAITNAVRTDLGATQNIDNALTVALAVTITTNATYFTGKTAGAVSKRLIGVNASGLVSIDVDAVGTTLGAGVVVAGAITTASDAANDLGSGSFRFRAGFFSGTVTVATLTATNVGGTLSTAAQPNVTSLGTLTSVTVSGAVSLTSANATVSATTAGTSEKYFRFASTAGNAYFGINDHANTFFTGAGADATAIYSPGNNVFISHNGATTTFTSTGVVVAGVISPSTDNARDFGSGSFRWKDGYFAGLLSLEGATAVSIGGWSGKARIQYDATGSGMLSVLNAANGNAGLTALTLTLNGAIAGATTLLATGVITQKSDSALIRTTNAANTIQQVAIGSVLGLTGAGSTSTGGMSTNGDMTFYTAGSATARLTLNATGGTFSGVVVAGAATDPVKIANDSTYGVITFNSIASLTTGMAIGGRINGAEGIYYNTPTGTVHALTVAGTGVAMVSASALYPFTDNATDNGTASFRWRDGYYSRNVTIGGTLGVVGQMTIGNHAASTNADLVLDGATTNNFGPVIRLWRGGTVRGYIGTDSAINGGASDTILIYSVNDFQVTVNNNSATAFRINSTGALTSTGTAIYSFNTTVAGSYAYQFLNSAGSPTAASVLYLNTTQTAGTSAVFIDGYHSGTTVSFRVFTNGNVQNTNNSYGAISDVREKIDVVAASSQWADILALNLKKFRHLADPDGALQLGVIAQDLVETSPGLVDVTELRDVDGEPTGETRLSVKYSVLYMKAVGALQEAMRRVESLEAWAGGMGYTVPAFA